MSAYTINNTARKFQVISLLHYLRKQQWLGLILVPLFLMVWLSLTCQNCFAASADVTAACDHQVSMECCSLGHGHMSDQSAQGQCDLNHVSTQVVVVDDAALHVNDHATPDFISTDAVDFPFSRPFAHSYTRVRAADFIQSVFKQYRVLLI